MSNGISLGFAAYPVADIERATAFYRAVVGLGEATVLNDDYAEFDLGNAAFGLDAGGEALGITPGSAFSAAFEVEDYEKTLQRLRSHGADVFHELETSICRVAFVRDSEGNGFTIHKTKAVP